MSGSGGAGLNYLISALSDLAAAGAGEYGRGFGVVAGEVKERAAQTVQATGRIEGAVGDVTASAPDSVSAVAAASPWWPRASKIAMSGKPRRSPGRF
jgi:hypothetical protein